MNDARDKQNKVQSTSKIHNQRKKIDVNRKNLRDSALYQIPIPRDSRDNETRSYEALFHLLARKKMIPLGLLRGTYKATKSGPNYNKMPYVYTNPPKETELFSCDRVFVLSQTPIRIVTTAKVCKYNCSLCYKTYLVTGQIYRQRLMIWIYTLIEPGRRQLKTCSILSKICGKN